MKRSATVGWVLPLLATLSGTAVIALAAYSQDAEQGDEASTRAAVGRLNAILRRERTYFGNNHAFTSSIDDLGMDTPTDDTWTYTILNGQLESRPFLLIEADNGRQRLSIDRQGRMHRSELQLFPPIPVWLPAEGGKSHAEAE